MLVVAYLAITRIGALEAAKIGVSIGPVPLFLTEWFVFAILGVVLLTSSKDFIGWLLTGSTASWPGLSLWLLLLASICYCAAAIGQWGVLAVRDLAIFGYGVVFPLTYFVLDTPAKAAGAMRWFTYSGVVLALALIGDSVSGLHVLFKIETRGVEGFGAFESYGGGDVGGIIVFSMSALLAYAATLPRRRLLHLALALICFCAVMIGQTRSAMVGLCLASFFVFLGARPAVRMALIAALALSIAIVASLPVLFPGSAIATLVRGFLLTLQSAGGAAKDANAYFRLLRWNAVLDLWKSSPVFGVGFGRPVIPAALIDASETGLFNVGLPHNTYLTILARFGLLGFVLILVPWFGSVVSAFLHVRRVHFGADLLAAGAAMIAMMGFAFFVLFLERPLHAASLWMLAAMAARLAQPERNVSRPSWTPLAYARQIALGKGFR
jgi:O-antigen ligase